MLKFCENKYLLKKEIYTFSTKLFIVPPSPLGAMRYNINVTISNFYVFNVS